MTEIVAVPVATAVAIPWVPGASLTLATVKLDELHTTALVTSCVLPSVKLLVATKFWIAPLAIEALLGLMLAETAEITTRGAKAVIPP